MKLTHTLTKDMLARVLQYLVDHPVTPSIARAVALRAKIAALFLAFTQQSGLQVHGRGGYRAGAKVRRTLAQQLRTMLVDMAATARGLDPDYPGMREQFRLGRQAKNHQRLLATAQAFQVAVGSPEVKQLFTDRAFPLDFDAQLSAKITELGAAVSRKSSGLQSQKQGTVSMDALSREVTKTMRELRALMVKYLRDSNPVLLEVWNAAARIYRQPASAASATKESGASEPVTAPQSAPLRRSGTLQSSNETEETTPDIEDLPACASLGTAENRTTNAAERPDPQ